MTSATANAPAQLWSSMPGWGIAADLTPPELTNSRQLGVLRKWIAVGLVALLAACTGGYLYALHQHSAADRSLQQVQARTSQLQAEARRYIGVTRIQGSVTSVQAQIAGLMASDVDLVKLIDQVHSSLPGAMSISTESISISPAGVASAGASISGLDTSGLARIGDVKLSGTARTLDDLAAYVDKLKVLPGIVDVLPTSNSAGEKGVAYSVTIGLTSALISHRFDATTPGSK